MATEFPRVRGIPSCINLSTYVQGMSDYELLCEVVQVVNKLSELASLSVITYADPLQWDIASQYSQNTVVVDPQTGTAYLSVQPVPAGVQITNADYWTPIFTLQTFTTALKRAIALPQETIGAGASADIPAKTVFWAGEQLVYSPNDIPVGTIIIPGTNCQPVTVVDLINEVYQTAYAVYNASKTAIELGWVRTAPDPSIEAGDVHKYILAEETIKITGRG